jgi:hypothetical protein
MADANSRWVSPAMRNSLECCRLNPPEVLFCRTCGRLLHSQGTLRNPEKGWEYEVIDVLVQGGMSTTYRVYSPPVDGAERNQC